MSRNEQSHHHLRSLLYTIFRGEAEPVLRGADFSVPAASMWTGARTWIEGFRAAGLKAGDRVVTRLPRSPAHVFVTIACWWEGLTLCPVAPDDRTPAADLVHLYDAALLIDWNAATTGVAPDPHGAAPEGRLRTHPAGDPTDGIALILATSGSAGNATRVALSHTNVLHQLLTHRDVLAMAHGDRVLSVLPWHHAFGLLVDLWPALLSGAMVQVDGFGGRRTEEMVRAVREHRVSHLSMVPLQAVSILRHTRGVGCLRALRGGVVGGAPISASLARELVGSRLRVGYGQTEASPGIALGTPGRFSAGTLGVPLACDWDIVDGELRVRGRNVCAGFWRDRALERLCADRWLPTGDLVQAGPDGLRFIGRRDHRFKLSNGRMIDAPALEHRIERAVQHAQAIVVPAASGEVTVVLVREGGDAPVTHAERRHIERALGTDAGRLAGVRSLPSNATPRTPKGEIDRRSLADAPISSAGMNSLAA